MIFGIAAIRHIRLPGAPQRLSRRIQYGKGGDLLECDDLVSGVAATRVSPLWRSLVMATTAMLPPKTCNCIRKNSGVATPVWW